MNSQQQFTDEEIKSIGLSQLVGYLASHGWSRVTAYGGNGWIYAHKSGSRVLVPSREDVSDYVYVVGEVMEAVARVDDVDAVGIFQGIRFRRHDTFRIQAVDSDAADGTISPDAASGLYTGSPQLWEWSVKRALLDANDAQQYWQQARFGQTERGSYVVTMISPPVFSGREITLDADAIEQTPTRKVTNQLRATIQLARCILDDMHNGDETAIQRARKRGLESTACDALFKMVKPFESIRCQISESQLVPKAAAEPSAIEFRRGDAPLLKQLAADLDELELNGRSRNPLQDYSLGMVD